MLQNSMKFFYRRFYASEDETLKGYLVQECQGTRSSRPAPARVKDAAKDFDIHSQFKGAGYRAKQSGPPPQDENAPAPGSYGVNELHVRIVHHSKLFTDDTGRFSFWARSGNQYGMVAYHSSNVILGDRFKSQKDVHRLAAYVTIM